MAVHNINDGDVLCAVHITSREWKHGLNFYSDPNDFVQVGTWRYAAGTELKAHRHNAVPRVAERTQEVLYVKRGRIAVCVYGLRQQLIGEFAASEGDIIIMLRGGHGYLILEDDTHVLEVKNGPYPGPEQDRTRI